jgi:hypothetical protein
LTDESKPDFTVVDRRRAAQVDGSTEAESRTETDQPQTPVDAETAAPDSVEPESADAAGDAGGEEDFAPDPAMLLSLAASRMDTRTLATVLMSVFDAHAWRDLGLIAYPGADEPTKDLPSAQLAIDCVQFLLGKVEAGLPDAVRREAQRRLSDLRLNYLAKLRE